MNRSIRYALIASFFAIAIGSFALAQMGVGPPPALPPAGDSLSTEPFNSWAWIGLSSDQQATNPGGSIESSPGFLQLNCNSIAGYCDSVSSLYPLVTVDLALGEVNGYGWLGTDQTDSGIPHSIGWLNFDPEPLRTTTYTDGTCSGVNLYPSEPCYAAKIDTSNEQKITGWARIPSIALAGDAELGTTNMQNDWGWVLLNGTNSADGQEYSVLYRDNAFDGWAWSGGGSLADGSYSNAVGLGWINFSNGGTGATPGSGQAYFSTERGDVYAGGGIRNAYSPSSLSEYNATFMILSGGGPGSIVNFNSELLGDNNFVDENYLTADPLNLPDADNNYQSELGDLDIDRLTTVVSGTQNSYGNPVSTYGSLNGVFSSSYFLNGEVILIDDGTGPGQVHTLNSSVTWMNGTSSITTGNNFDGTGVIIVNGDLNIDANTFYNNTALVDLKNLASVVWIIRGNLNIGPSVSNVVGSFFVIGDDSIGDGVSDGIITTEASNASQLTIYGLLMARQFLFLRTYEGLSGIDEPAELIYYDSRILANPPSGLQDWTSTLPFPLND